MVLNTFTAYRSGGTVKWNDAELAIYLVYSFGEIKNIPAMTKQVILTKAQP